MIMITSTHALKAVQPMICQTRFQAAWQAIMNDSKLHSGVDLHPRARLDTANYCKSKLPRFHWPVVFHVCPGNPGEQSFQQSAQGRANDALQRASNWLRNAKRGVFVSPNSSPSVQSSPESRFYTYP